MDSKRISIFVHFDPFGFRHFPLQGKDTLINRTAKHYITVEKHKQSFLPLQGEMPKAEG